MNIAELPLVVVDTETTGPNAFDHEILSYAFVPLDGSSPLSGHVNIGPAKWSDYARNNFRNFESSWEAEALSPANSVKRITDYINLEIKCAEIILVGHNVGFDRTFLQKLAHKAGFSKIAGISHRSIDTFSILAFLHLRGKIPASALTSDGAFDYFNIQVPDLERHTALGDAKATACLFKKLLEVAA